MTRSTLALVLLSLVIPTAVTNAEIFVPSGLNLGDTYHLAFVTSGTRDATSSDIADYNTFVRDQAELTGAFTKDFGIGWNAIASTPTVDARDNAPATAPVYLLDGTLVSSAGRPMYGGPLWSPFDTDQFLSSAAILAWTGSGFDGESAPPFSLGGSMDAIAGATSVVDPAWLFAVIRASVTDYSLYALSEELTVVPEPAAVVSLLSMGIVGLIGYWWRRRKA